MTSGYKRRKILQKYNGETYQHELKAEFDRKQKELEKEVDEGRQREMKGTLIISSPERGNMGTLAAHQPIHDYQGNTVRMETDMDLVLRMVAIKTGVRIPISDVVACHRIGKNKKSHSFVLKIGNRQPFSSHYMTASCEFLT